MLHELPFWLQGLAFAPDDKSGGGSGDKNKPTDDDQTDDDDQDTDDTDDADGDADNSKGKGGKPKSEKTYTKEEVTDLINERLDRDRKDRERQAKKELTESQKAKLKNAKSFEELSDVQATEIASLTSDNASLTTERDTARADLDKANAAITNYVESLKEGHPESVLKLLKGSSLADQLEWLLENRPEPSDDDGAGKKTIKKITQTPKSDKSKPPSDDELEGARQKTARAVTSNF